MTRARDLADSADKDIAGTVTLDDIVLSNDMTVADNGKVIFGAGSDLQIYHDGSESFIDDAGTGSLYVRSNKLYIQKYTGETMATFTADGAVDLRYDDSQKLVTTPTGIDVTGTAVTDGLTVAGNVSVDGGTIKLDGNYPVGTGNVALGNAALDDGSLSGNFNTAMGNNVLTANTSGAQNTAYGAAAMQTNTTGANNTALGGNGPLQANTSGGSNTAVGYAALFSNTTASSNTAVGYAAGYSNTTSIYNVFVGTNSGYNINGGAGYNTFVGISSGYSNTTGQENTFIGKEAGYYVTTGTKNTIIGGYNGNEGGLDIRTSSNNIVLSDGDGNPRVVVDSSGFMGVNKVTPTATLHVDRGAMANAAHFSRTTDGTLRAVIIFSPSSGGDVGSIDIANTSTSYTTSSDYRLKENVSYDWDATTRLKQLKPARFNFIIEPDQTIDGFLAHEVSSVVAQAVSGEKDAVDENGNIKSQSIDHSKLVPLLVKTIQELEARITALENP